MWQIKGFQITASIAVQQDETKRGQDHLSLAFELAHVFDLELKLAALSVQDEMLALDTIRIAIVRAQGRIKRHLLQKVD